ncbi:uncharacterized protein N7446_009299 [Penicillium canescens]|uniref:F-box domain-containing protein n=1 Tax=Penicillium canescens TaxID=5083 RepID=A0AAD6I691_PENCN|nr:uncharacterized protein N7446_009299 [Penicillium canescens]KAJ6034549.1 hypothetical protein N7460_008724 [Penicillium canescens]KAJ6046208.1 hypothetical protein N7444_007462 [Penicillium canescens]KAJ6053287.1 hypothetical protein N7446_009299 [Penicillium canescens]
MGSRPSTRNEYRKEANFDNLPQDLLLQITDYLDVQSTINLSLSCKDMHAILEETAKRKSKDLQGALPSDEVYIKHDFKTPDGIWARRDDIEYDENRDDFYEDEHVTPSDDEPFAQAVRSGKYEKAQYYLRLGVDPNVYCLGGAHMLSLAVHSGSPEMVQLPFDYGADLENIDYCTSMSALAHAVYTQQQDVIRKLIELGVDVSKEGLAGYIAHTCSVEIMKIFLDANLDLNRVGELTWTGHRDFEDGDHGWKLVHHLAVRNDQGMFDLLLPQLTRKMINARNLHDETPLHLALEGDDPGLSMALIRAGADINARDCDTYSPLDRALLNGHLEIAREIIERPDVELGVENENGYTELHLATRRGDVEIIRMFLLRGAKVRRGNCFDSPLSCAIQTKRLDVVKLLCEEAQDHPFTNDEGDDDEQAAAIEEARELKQHAIAEYLQSIPASSYKTPVRPTKKPRVGRKSK